MGANPNSGDSGGNNQCKTKRDNEADLPLPGFVKPRDFDADLEELESPAGDERRKSSPEYFVQFMLTHKKNYTSRTSKYGRFGIFKSNMQQIIEANQASPAPKGQYRRYAINSLTDFTNDEFERQFLSDYSGVPRERNKTRSIDEDLEADNALHKRGLFGGGAENCPSPSDTIFDWRTKGVVTPVQVLLTPCFTFQFLHSIQRYPSFYSTLQ